MSSTYSDHTQPQIDITQYIPEVYQSEVSSTLFNSVFNRHLTKDDTQYVSGIIGQPNPQALINRQIVEPTPYRQAYQLAPTMYTQVGTVQTALSFKAFQDQLKLDGVDMNRYPVWGNTLQFNWVPPVNIDMLVNYQDYYWAPTVAGTPAQYLTIENRCNKASSRVKSYEQVLAQYGSTFPVIGINYITNAFIVSTKLDLLFVPKFVFNTVNSPSNNLLNAFWTVVSSTYDIHTNITTIIVAEPISTVSATAPALPSIGQWWFDTVNQSLYTWTGVIWQIISTAQAADISIIELLNVFQAEADCFCGQNGGWDVGLWDDNQLGSVVWNTALIASISSSTAPVAPALYDLWYNTALNVLNQWNGTTWVTVVVNFSTIVADTTGQSTWDSSSIACTPQIPNQWTQQNQWVHKTEVQSFTAVKKAQLPILEYNSNLELNTWVYDTRGWKYRSDPSKPFVSTTAAPTRFELEPIKGFIPHNVGTTWYLYLFDKTATVNYNIDYTSTFVPGFRFRAADDHIVNVGYTVVSSEYRELTSAEVSLFPAKFGPNYLVTIVQIAETYVAPVGPVNLRLEPLYTSQKNPISGFDTWCGYYAQWMLDTTVGSPFPAAPQSWDIARRRSLNATIVPVSIPSGILYVGDAHQELTLSIAGVTTIMLDSGLQYNPAVATTYATPGSGDIRVYVNGIRQYGSYTELSTVGAPNYTVIGYTSYPGATTMQIPYITGIQFITPLDIFDVVKIEVGTAALTDMGMVAVPVRTVEDDTAFAAGIVAATQPVYKSLSQYRQVEQVKTTVNQYPLFNVYHVVTGNIVTSSPIFSFSEDSSYPINTQLQRRIVASSDGREYQFTQYLLDEDDHLLYGYRNMAALPIGGVLALTNWWYNPNTSTIQSWDGEAWNSYIQLTATDGHIVMRHPIISSVSPTTPAVYDLTLWYNYSINVLYVWNAITLQWTTFVTTIFVGADPSLQTIWKHGLNNEQFIPQYVDGNRQPITPGNPAGDWEQPDQWFFNPEHRNKSNLLLSELTTHFSTIISNQQASSGLQSGGVFALTQDQYNYGLGGTIKEHNDSFDTLISAFNVTNTNPLGVIEFAQDEYASNMLLMQDLFNKTIVSLVSQYSQVAIADISSFVSNSIITTYEENSFAEEVYNDTSAYNAATGQGIQNWIATSPMFGFSSKHVPHLNIDPTFTELYCHDGHRIQVIVSVAFADRFARQIVALPDTRSGLGTLGIVSANPIPATIAAYAVSFNTGNAYDGLLSGTFWYQIAGGVLTLYKLNVYAVTTIAPTFYINGVELPDNTMYYNPALAAVFSKVGLSWQQITSTGAGNITPLWTVIDFQMLLANMYLEVENRLYDVCPPDTSKQLDYQISGISVQATAPKITNVGSYWYNPTNDVLSTWIGAAWSPVSIGGNSPLTLAIPASGQSAEQSIFNSYNFDRFMSYVNIINITAPLINTGYTLTDPFTWNYISSNVTSPPKTGLAPANAACWQEVYTCWYGTPYPHLEPWTLQGYVNEPSWWIAQYKDTTNTRVWDAFMWSNILSGIIPVGELLPNGNTVGTGNPGQVTEYNYVSVNVGSTPTADGYAVDGLLPPFYALGTGTISSLYTNYSQIINPAADYAFGDVGPVEWLWLVSSQHVYDNLVIAFRMQPIRFMHYAFGPQYVTVDNLQVETTFNKVYAHQDTLFQGDLYNTNQVYSSRGLNQWYTNYNRFTGIDTNDQFKSLWNGWSPELTYQFAGIIDAETLAISNSLFDISNQDYSVILVNNGIVKDIWLDAFEISILNMPPSLPAYNSQSGWKLELNTLSPIPRMLTYYGAKSYSCVPDKFSGQFFVFRYSVVSTSAFFQSITVAGDQTDKLKQTATVRLTSPTNSGIFTIQGSLYQPASNTTKLTVLESVVDAGALGYIDLQNVVAPWNTGDRVVIGSSQLLPAPLLANTAYYVIRISNNVYRLAETPNDAFANNFVDLTSLGSGLLTISEVLSTFVILGGTGSSTDVWYHYALDTTDIRTIIPPYTFMSIQTLLNIIDGYSAYQQTTGISYGISDTGDFDPNTGRLIDWQLETERFINFAYNLRNTRMNISDRYSATVAVSSTTLTFTTTAPQWASGTAVVVGTSGILPTPLIPKAIYYYQQTVTPGIFQLSITSTVASPADLVTFTSSGSGTLFLSLQNNTNVFPTFEINPSRNSIWINTPQGVLSNVVVGPYTNIRSSQTIFDQYGRPLNTNILTVYREDKRSHIAIKPAIPNDVNVLVQNDPYNYIHFGGGHFFIEGFEHFVLFNNYTVAGNLVYNAFLGLDASKFSISYYEKRDYSLRPTLGGYYLYKNQFKRNIEGSAFDLQNLYNLQTVDELSESTQHARYLVGYSGATNYMNLINVNLQSQFRFYQGMIKSKGSVNSVTAYINSRRFVSASVDECWAWKLAEFGDVRPRAYPEIKLFATDALVDDIRLEFLSAVDIPTDPDIAADVANGFQLVSFSDGTRWSNFPDQKGVIVSPLFLDANVTSVTVIYTGRIIEAGSFVVGHRYIIATIGTTPTDFTLIGASTNTVGVIFTATGVGSGNGTASTIPTALQVAQGAIQYWFDSATNITYQPNGSDWTGSNWPIIPSKVVKSGSYVYFKQDTISDTVRVYRHTLGSNADFTNYTTDVFLEGTGLDQYVVINAEVTRMNTSGFTDIMIIYTINPSQTKISPARLLDTQSNVVVQTSPLWHPALGYHAPIAIHNVDTISPIDPAYYQVSLSDPATNAWNDTNVGTVWFDTNELGYLPYYDAEVYPNVNDRLHSWGSLAPWAAVNVFAWTQSLVPPSGWDAAVLADSTNTTLPQNSKATGTPRRTVFNRTRKPIPTVFPAISPGTGGTATITVPSVVSNGDSVLFIETPTLHMTVPALSGTDLIYAIYPAWTTKTESADQVIVTLSPSMGITTVLGLVGPYTFTLNINNNGNTTYTIIAIGTDTLALIASKMATAIGSPATVSVVGNAFVISTGTTGSLPTGLTASVKYTVMNVTGTGPGPYTFQVQDPDLLTIVDITDNGAGLLTVVPAFSSTGWIRQPLIREKMYAVFDIALPFTGGTITLTNSLWEDGDAADIYKNGVLAASAVPVSVVGMVATLSTAVSGLVVSEMDIIDIIRPVHNVTTTEAAFNPDITDDGTINIQWKQDYEYTLVTAVTGSTLTGLISTPLYYFWVQQSTTTPNTQDSTSLSVSAVAQQLQSIPTPYFIVQKPEDDPTMEEEFGYGLIQYGTTWAAGSTAEQFFIVPVLYRQAILRNLASYITDDNRFVMQFTRDLTLRDNIKANGSNMNLKDVHEEWTLIRRLQPDTINITLWNRLTEAIIGYTLADPTIRVPSLERQLYDEMNGTDTQYGLGTDQAFVNGPMALATIIAYLEDPTNNFYPVNINTFFSNNNFNSPAAIQTAMAEIYNTFPATNVNDMWFNTLQDAFTTKAKYKELMKTSWVALQGVHVINSGGIFDD